jgi:taurine dioxygenase
MFDVVPLSPTIGAEVRGLSLADRPDDATKADIAKAFAEHKVLFFRDQGDISTEDHIEFCRMFGELEVHPFVPPKPGYPEVMVLISNEDRKGNENTWHSDVTWRQEPSLGSMLRAVELPAVGGDTLFADMEAAYEGLGDKMRDMVDGLEAVHDFTKVFGRYLKPEKAADMHEKYPPATHPVIRTHPVSGRKSIYVNAAFTSHIVGLRAEESQQLLTYLFAQASIPERQCRFRWEPGSFALWDNRCVQHYAVSDYWPNRRVMERVTIVGDRPV